MTSVLRGFVIYLVLLLAFRLSGKRSLSQLSPFSFVLLIIIGEASQQALLGDDYSVINGIIVILTLVGLELLLDSLKIRYRGLESYLEGTPLVLIDNGTLLKNRMRKANVDESDILQAARETQGIETIDDVKYAVLERTGGISIIPKK